MPQPPDNQSPQDRLEQIFSAQGLRFGSSLLKPPTHAQFFPSWVEKGYGADMEFLNQQVEERTQPEKVWTWGRSVISYAIPYIEEDMPQSKIFPHLKTALYSRGEDYHRKTHEDSRPLIDLLHSSFPGEKFELVIDSRPLLERSFGEQAGLGWVGKNTCLIDRKSGSYFFLAEIITSLTLQARAELSANFCGTCTQCIDACPTQALTPYELDSRKCISYWTIESKKSPPEKLRAGFQDWLFGCDICQAICPWNKKVFGKNLNLNQLEIQSSDEVKNEIREILEFSLSQLNKKIRGSSFQRAGAKKLKRSALIIAVNLKFVELKPLIDQLSFQDLDLEEVRTWALKKMDPSRITQPE